METESLLDVSCACAVVDNGCRRGRIQVKGACTWTSGKGGKENEKKDKGED